MNNTALDHSQVFGFFELDEAGTVLYSRPVSGKSFGTPDASIVGQDFFSKVFVSRNAGVFRRNFQNFTSGNQMTEKFVFSYDTSEETLLLRVMLVKVLENNRARSKKIIYVDIRQN